MPLSKHFLVFALLITVPVLANHNTDDNGDPPKNKVKFTGEEADNLRHTVLKSIQTSEPYKAMIDTSESIVSGIEGATALTSAADKFMKTKAKLDKLAPMDENYRPNLVKIRENKDDIEEELSTLQATSLKIRTEMRAIFNKAGLTVLDEQNFIGSPDNGAVLGDAGRYTRNTKFLVQAADGKKFVVETNPDRQFSVSLEQVGPRSSNAANARLLPNIQADLGNGKTHPVGLRLQGFPGRKDFNLLFSNNDGSSFSSFQAGMFVNKLLAAEYSDKFDPKKSDEPDNYFSEKYSHARRRSAKE